MDNFFRIAATAIYGIAAVVLMLLALAFIGMAAVSVVQGVLGWDQQAATQNMLDGIGLVILGLASVEIAKFLFDEEIARERELRRADEARRTLTKFLTIIIIAVSLEGLVFVFKAGRTHMPELLYPAILLAVVILMVFGMAAYQWLSRQGEAIEPHKEPRGEDAR